MPGTGMGVLPFHTFALPLECSVSMGFRGGLGELAGIVALAEAGHLRRSVQRFPLSRVAGPTTSSWPVGSEAGPWSSPTGVSGDAASTSSCAGLYRWRWPASLYSWQERRAA